MADPLNNGVLTDARAELEAFLRDACLTGPAYQTPAAALYARYTDWCASHGLPATGQQHFGKGLTALGFTRYTNNGTWYRGLGLRAAPSAPSVASHDAAGVPSPPPRDPHTAPAPAVRSPPPPVCCPACGYPMPWQDRGTYYLCCRQGCYHQWYG